MLHNQLRQCLPCAAAGILVARELPFTRREFRSQCQENKSASYYGSYSSDRFSGGIGRRVGIDETGRKSIANSGVDRILLVTEKHGNLRKWATEDNWKEATQIHKAAYFTRSENLAQEAVLQKIRGHYVSCSKRLDDCKIEAGLFRLEDVSLFKDLVHDTTMKRIPSIVYGVFDEKKERCVVDFANKRLGGAWLGYGFVQEEKMFIERFDFGALCARSLLQMEDPTLEPIASVFSMHPNEAWILRGAPAYAELPWYGRTPNDGLQKAKLLNPVDDVDTSPTVIALDAIKADFERYRTEHLEMMLVKAYTGFVAAKSDPELGGITQIATGSWGCGAFYNNERVMFVIQSLAATLADVELTHHVLGDGLNLTPAFELLERAIVQKWKVADVLSKLSNLCTFDTNWRTKYDPHKGARSKPVAPTAKL